MAGKTIGEQIVGLKATRDSLQKSMDEAAQKSIDESRSMNTAESEAFDEAESQIKAIDKDIERLSRLEAIKAGSATIVPKTVASEGAPARITEPAQVKTVEKLEPGIAAARFVMCLMRAKGNHDVAFKLAERHFPQTESIVKTLKAQSEGANLAEMMKLKTAVAAGTTTDTTWASPLVYANNWGGDFISYLRPRTLIGQANFRPVPFNVRIGGQTSGGSANWVGQGTGKPLAKFDFPSTTIPFTKVSGIAVLTQELARFSDPSAEMLVRDALADCVIERIDSDLFDPDKAAVANVSPAGLLNGVAPVAGPVTKDPDDIRAALLRLWAAWDSTTLGMRPAYYTTPAVARLLSFTREALGTLAFPGMTPQGGTLDGIPVRVSQYLANNGGSGGAPFILVDEAEVYLADDGSVTIDASEEASLEMSDAPASNSSTPTAAQMVSMWQTNSIALRAERFIWWGATG